MSEGLLTVLKFCFLAVLWLFFVRVVRVAWAEVHAPAASPPQPVAAGASPSPAASPASPMGAARVTILEPPERRGRSYQLGQELTLGRSNGCHVSVPEDSFVSQTHARISRRDGGFWLEDLGSTNGTYLNAKAVSSPALLHRGDRIQVGRTVLEVNR